MSISADVLEYQSTHTFEDTVAKFFKEVAEEYELSYPGADKHEAIWEFSDGSMLQLVDGWFYAYIH